MDQYKKDRNQQQKNYVVNVNGVISIDGQEKEKGAVIQTNTQIRKPH